MSWLTMPNSLAKNVGSALLRAVVRYTFTWMQPFGSLSSEHGLKVMSVAGATEGGKPNTRLDCVAANAFLLAGPFTVLSVALSNARAIAPASAPASAEFCA
jgi:hypothetical protein